MSWVHTLFFSGIGAFLLSSDFPFHKKTTLLLIGSWNNLGEYEKVKMSVRM